MTMNEYFDQIIFINLARRTDRLAHAMEEFQKHGIDACRFEGIDMGELGNHGCTASHRAVLELIIEKGWKKTLIFEDDVEFRFPPPNTQELFSALIFQVPKDWFMLYIGGHYAEKPKRRINESIIHMGRMKTTSSYAVTLEAAKEMAPFIEGVGPIDELYGMFHDTKPCYIFQPRLAYQYESYSDLQKAILAYQGCMEDTRHEQMV